MCPSFAGPKFSLLLLVLVLFGTSMMLSTDALVGPSPSPKPVSPESIAVIQNLYDQMQCRWRSLGCSSTDGVFALTYIHMTRIVLEGMESDYFDDGDLMGNFTLNFANRYLKAIDQKRRCGQSPSLPWQEAFNYGDSKKSSPIEDMILGINAHINLDLAMTVEDLYDSGVQNNKDDYDRINDLLESAGQAINDDIQAHYEPLMGILANSFTSPIFLQLIYGWRENAWFHGESMATASTQAERDIIYGMTVGGAVALAQPFKTYNAIGFFLNTDKKRKNYCNANPPPAPNGPCAYGQC